MTATDVPVTTTATTTDQRLEAHRAAVRAHCLRILRSPFDADDATQETLVRAWRSLHRFEGRASLRSWLRSIATNVCLDMLRSRQRRPAPVDIVPIADQDDRTIAASVDPADLIVERERLQQAFLATLLHLPPRQRAALVMCEVLNWRATDVAELLGDTVASVNSALQRARSALADHDVTTTRLDRAGKHRLDDYVDAFEHYDVAALVTLLQARSPQVTTGLS
jgi:RNA polymerase sigma-70 factor, ECF subfamily